MRALEDGKAMYHVQYEPSNEKIFNLIIFNYKFVKNEELTGHIQSWNNHANIIPIDVINIYQLYNMLSAGKYLC